MNTTPLYAKAAAIVGRPAVLIAALLMSAPAEISLARTAGFSGGTEFLAPFVLSLYAVCAAVVATIRRKGDRGRLSSILGAGMALGFALSAQVVAHLLSAGHVSSGPWLIAAISSVPSIACAHLLHLCVLPRDKAVGVNGGDVRQEATEEPEKAEEDTDAVTPAAPRKKGVKGRSKPSRPTLAAIREAAQNIDAVGKLVTGPALAKALGVSDRTGARYLKRLQVA